ncbi:hypothetical protein M0638_12635 [Roseomonas sp. NAR14]|uniref:Uncharacterized protein n=1 Tax=Roseomonas acroporae TaxID=2937791 RepID=A0A9X2BU83_9PROT|nr:hypothetical protein [Roseomonas acroporae]MCK8785232.1 hypothetical protein [Roseomonas acroporae]
MGDLHRRVGEMHTSCIDRATEWVRDSIRDERAKLGTLDAAYEAVSRFFGISPRRAKSYWWRQVTHLAVDEYERLKRRQADRLRLARLRAEHEMAALDALLAKIDGETDEPPARVGTLASGLADVARATHP